MKFSKIKVLFWENIQKIQIEGGIFMTEKHIKLSPDTVVTFVKKSQQCDFNVDISYGHTEVDAKSLLGMLSLDFNRIMHVKYYGKNEDLEGYINELAVE
ncbi:HPr family phosphocarrier protein [Clostridiaceae bacterium AF31-3BH]|nr:HPr family phosphocarrier protein [Clostridiaceae bacterium AF31-3BH]